MNGAGPGSPSAPSAGGEPAQRVVLALGSNLGDRLATVARLDVLPRIVWRTAPLRGEAWRRSLHTGIVTATARR